MLLSPHEPRRIAVVVKGYPRLSETFIAQEILALETRGVDLEIWSLRHPTERAVHPMNRQIKAPVTYLPEYLYEEPVRVLRGVLFAMRQPAMRKLMRTFWADLKRDLTANRIRRLGQAFVMARELAADVRHIHTHYLHTPASVVRYAALLTGRTWTFSAHAKDIWTTPDWEKREKLAEALWGVTCTAQGAEHLQALGPCADHVTLVYHGLDLSRFPSPPDSRPMRDGSDPADPVRIVSVGRAVAKKGFGDLLRALAALPSDLHWRFAHVGGGDLLNSLKAQVAEERAWRSRGVSWRKGAARHHRAAARRGPLRAAVQESSFRRPGWFAQCADGSRRPETRDRGDRFRRHPRIHSPRDRRRAGAAGRMGIAFERHQSSGARTGTARCAGAIPPSSGCGGIFPWRAAST